MVGMSTKRIFNRSQGQVEDVGEDKDKEEPIHPRPVAHSPGYVHLQTGGKKYFCQSLLLFPY